MGTDGKARPIAEAVGESWLSTLEDNAAFDRPWVEAAAGWLLGAFAGAGATVVDVGCGAGGAACAFARHPGAARVLAVDRDPRLIEVARRRARAGGVAERVRWASGEVGRLPLRPGGADLVWASGVVHHVPDQQAAVTELAGLARPGGTVALVEGGLPMRCLPDDVGVGDTGLEARLDEARARWFADLRAELAGPSMPYGWPAALAAAGLVELRSRSYVAESTAPLDGIGRRIASQHLTHALEELGDRLAAGDREALRRLVDPADPLSIHRRDDLTVTAVRTIHAATRAR
jgi:SAM-dependent methyltransferase